MAKRKIVGKGSRAGASGLAPPFTFTDKNGVTFGLNTGSSGDASDDVVARLRAELDSQRTLYLAKIDQLSGEIAALTRARARADHGQVLEGKYAAALAQALSDKKLFFSTLVRVLQNVKVENLGG